MRTKHFHAALSGCCRLRLFHFPNITLKDNEELHCCICIHFNRNSNIDRDISTQLVNLVFEQHKGSSQYMDLRATMLSCFWTPKIIQFLIFFYVLKFHCPAIQYDTSTYVNFAVQWMSVLTEWRLSSGKEKTIDIKQDRVSYVCEQKENLFAQSIYQKAQTIFYNCTRHHENCSYSSLEELKQ